MAASHAPFEDHGVEGGNGLDEPVCVSNLLTNIVVQFDLEPRQVTVYIADGARHIGSLRYKAFSGGDTRRIRREILPATKKVSDILTQG